MLLWEKSYNSTILELSTTWRWVVSFKPRPLYPQYALDRGLGEPQNRSGRCGVEKHLLHLLGIESPVVQSVACRYTDWREFYSLLSNYFNVVGFEVFTSQPNEEYVSSGTRRRVFIDVSEERTASIIRIDELPSRQGGLAYTSTPKPEAVHSPEMSADLHWTTGRPLHSTVQRH
jgi:hypothetical protein